MPLDRKQRVTLERVDDIHLRTAIVDSRRVIYDEGYTVDSMALDGMLKEQSLVPTVVCG